MENKRRRVRHTVPQYLPSPRAEAGDVCPDHGDGFRLEGAPGWRRVVVPDASNSHDSVVGGKERGRVREEVDVCPWGTGKKQRQGGSVGRRERGDLTYEELSSPVRYLVQGSCQGPVKTQLPVDFRCLSVGRTRGSRRRPVSLFHYRS